MANKTIYGCVNRSTGAIKFAGEACDSGDYIGCIVRSGDHAGQVAISVVEANCDDTYYGCIDRDTGQFAVSIPNDCCELGNCCNESTGACAQTTQANCPYTWLGVDVSCFPVCYCLAHPELCWDNCDTCGYNRVPKVITLSLSGTYLGRWDGSGVLEGGGCEAIYSGIYYGAEGRENTAGINIGEEETIIVAVYDRSYHEWCFIGHTGGCAFTGGADNEKGGPSCNTGGSASW